MPSSSNNQPIDKRKYHTASSFYLYCKQFVEESQAAGRRFKSEAQGFETAALKWNGLSAEEQGNIHALFKAQRKAADEVEKRRFKIRNGSRRDGNYDPVSLGLIKRLELKEEKDVANLEQRWIWSFDGKVSGVESERFIVVSVTTPSGAANPGAFTALALIEFSLAEGIVDEYHVNVEGVLGGASNARRAAVDKVLKWPRRNNRGLGESTPAFYAPPGQLEAAYNALTYLDDVNCSNGCTELEKKFSLVSDLANVDVLIRALGKWFAKEAISKPAIVDTTCCLATARASVESILIEFGM